MGALWDFFEKTAGKKKVVAPVVPEVPAGPQWHPEWAPAAGWKSPENPTGWYQPTKASQKKELFLWDQWKQQGETPEASAPLVNSMRNIINKYGVQGWANRVPISKPVLEQRALNLALQGMRKYDPTRDVLLSTHVTNQFKGMNRFVQSRQNFTRMTEERVKLHGPYNAAVSRLREKLERDPTVTELADEMGVNVRTLNKFMQEKKEDHLASGAMEDPFVEPANPDRLILELIRYELTPDEEKVLDHLTGQGGKALTTSTGDIAKKEGWNDSKVSHLKKKIQMRIEAAR